jgi:hypothetical protein
MPDAALRRGLAVASVLLLTATFLASVTGASASVPNHKAPHWTMLTTNTPPSNRDQVQMAYDPLLNATVLFGGYNPAGYALSDTWLFSGGNWTSISTTSKHTPAARWGGSLIYDPPMHAVVLFGGRSTSTLFNDTWVFNGTAWKPIHTPVAPSPRRHFGLVFDPAMHGLVLFGGGSASTGYLNDTWLFQNKTWTNVTGTLTGSPPARFEPAMAYDGAAGYPVLFGGNQPVASGSAYENDTWALYGGAWHNITRTVAPPYLYGPAMTWDPKLDCAVLVGENAVTSNEETWGFAGGAWTNLTPTSSVSPATRGNFGLDFDQKAGYVYLFAGDTPLPSFAYRDDSWSFR